MKKIIGSPIGLGEVNLTVDNRVRRNIKEYFGNVNNNSFIVEFVTDGTPPDIDHSKLKISIIADETHLNKVFIIEGNGVKTHFKPIKKVGNKLESETRVMLNSLWEKIFPSNARNPITAKLPSGVDEENEAEKEWAKEIENSKIIEKSVEEDKKKNFKFHQLIYNEKNSTATIQITSKTDINGKYFKLYNNGIEIHFKIKENVFHNKQQKNQRNQTFRF